MEERYAVISQVDKKGKVAIRRKSDGLVSRCKLSWLELVSEGVYKAKSKTKDLWLGVLEWTAEG